MPIISGPVLTHNLNRLALHTPPVSLANLLVEGKGNIINGVRKRLYDKVVPYSYNNPYGRVGNAVLFNNKIKMSSLSGKDLETLPGAKARDEIFAEYLGIPVNQRHYNKRLTPSRYRPRIGDKSTDKYYVSPTNKAIGRDVINLINDNAFLNKNVRYELDPALGTYKLSKGKDNKGEYVSYYDNWDLSPIHGGGAKDESLGIGTPVQFYNRFYLDDIMGLPDNAVRGTHWLPNITVYGKPKKKK